MRTLRPLDIELIVQSVKKTNRLVSCEEGFLLQESESELGMQINEKAFDYLDAPIMRVTGKDVPMPYAANLEALTLPQSDDIVRSALQICYAEEDLKMAIDILMPALSPIATEGILSKWLVKQAIRCVRET